MGPFGGRVLLIGLGAAGLGFTLLQLGQGASTMEGQHWVLMLICIAVGYALGRLWTQPARMLGLP